MSLALINAEYKDEGGEEKMGFFVGSCKICYSGIFCVFFNFLCMKLFYVSFPHLKC